MPQAQKMPRQLYQARLQALVILKVVFLILEHQLC